MDKAWMRPNDPAVYVNWALLSDAERRAVVAGTYEMPEDEDVA